MHSVRGKDLQNTPFLSPTQTRVSSFEAARPHQGRSLNRSGYGGLEVLYPNPKDFMFRKTSLYSTDPILKDPVGVRQDKFEDELVGAIGSLQCKLGYARARLALTNKQILAKISNLSRCE